MGDYTEWSAYSRVMFMLLRRYYRHATGVTDSFGVVEKDVVYCTLPLYHTTGGILSSGQMVLAGATLVLRKKFSASNFWTDCVKHQCTVSL